MKRTRADNRGMSLIELLVAILILGVLIAPLLNSFIISASSARKTRDLDAATNAASNFIENVKAMPLETMLARIPGILYDASAGFNFDNDDYDNTTDAENGKYVINLSNLRYGSKTYSGTLKLDAAPYAANINSTDVVKYSYSGMRCGTEMSNIDVTAAATLANLANLTAATMYSEALAALPPDGDPNTVPEPTNLTSISILNSMSRKLTLTVKDLTPDETNEEKKQIVITATSEYEYTLTYDGQTEVITPTTPFVQEFFGPYDKAIYFFYYPMYTGTEQIIIENNPGGENLDFTFFLVKQRPMEVAKIMHPGNDDDFSVKSARELWLKSADNLYIARTAPVPFITLTQRTGSTLAVLSSNIGVRLGEGADATGLRYREVLSGNPWSEYKLLGSELVELMRPNRLYSLSIELTCESPRDNTTVKIETTTLDFPNN